MCFYPEAEESVYKTEYKYGAHLPVRMALKCVSRVHRSEPALGISPPNPASCFESVSLALRAVTEAVVQLRWKGLLEVTVGGREGAQVQGE